jgi:succinyl-diaminopimelate desuccinylase
MSNTLELAQALICRPSITPKDEGCQTLIAERLAHLGFDIHPMPFNQTTNLWAKKGHTKPVLCFAGHTDVVPPGDTGWTSPPFTPTIQNGYLIGRGAADMKSSIAAMITAVERFIAKHPQHQGSIAFLITSDEEGPALDGTQAVLKELHVRDEIPQWCLVGEASSADKLADTIKVGRRGSLSAHLKIIGQQGHVAYPLLAKNAIHLALAPLKDIIEVEWDQGFGPFPATTLQISNIHAGTGAGNVIPGSCEVHFNLRFSPQLTSDEIQQKIDAILKHHGCEFEIKWTQGGKPFYTEPTHPFIQTVMQTIEQEMGYAPEASTSGGTSDGRFFAEYGTAVVELGPNNRTIHQVNERIEIEELDRLSVLYEQILVATLG